MDKDKLLDAIDGLFAYDTGCTDSGIHDERLRQDVIDYLTSDIGPGQVYHDILTEYVKGLLADDGYSLEDVKQFIEWLDDNMGIG